MFDMDPEEGEDVDDAEAGMMAAMGFGGFGSTKDKPVDGNQEGGAFIKQQRTWRQYMNRKGGFNRCVLILLEQAPSRCWQLNIDLDSFFTDPSTRSSSPGGLCMVMSQYNARDCLVCNMMFLNAPAMQRMWRCRDPPTLRLELPVQRSHNMTVLIGVSPLPTVDFVPQVINLAIGDTANSRA